jgi:glycosyltransferase involved in cell wall biosynthesis
LNIIIVNHKDPVNINEYSGISYFMNQALRSEFEEITEYNDFESPGMSDLVLKGNLKNILQPAGNDLTQFVKKNNGKADYILCQGGNSAIPYYRGNVPIAYWHDSSWNSIWRNYKDNSNYLEPRSFKVFKDNFRNLYLWDKSAMERSDLIVFSSDYVAEACIRNYRISPAKVKVIPFGANILNRPTESELQGLLEKKCKNEVINLTFIGKDWRRKGLVKAYKLVCKLNAIGIASKLNIIGCYPQFEVKMNADYVNLFGYIDKSNQADRVIFNQVLSDTHFLVHPTSAEPFGIVLCEANAYGVPVIGTNIDGLKTIVNQGVNGFLFKPNKYINEASILIKNMRSDFSRTYPLLFLSTVEQFNSRLNWQTSAKRLKNLLTSFIIN